MDQQSPSEVESVKLIECPRDAMQGISRFIPTQNKVDFINLLLGVGFDTVDFGSFVSPKLVPQMADTKAVLRKLNINSRTRLLTIIANLRGAREASQFDEITYLGYPFSISETFQKRNTNSTINESLTVVEKILDLCNKTGKTAVIYLSMAFGNPYGDEWNLEIIESHLIELINKGATIIALADTTGMATPSLIKEVYTKVKYLSGGRAELGLHLHSTPDTWKPKIDAAFNSGCRRFDAALKGFGGCPMAADTLTGNIATENLADYLKDKGLPEMNMENLEKALQFSLKIFN